MVREEQILSHMYKYVQRAAGAYKFEKQVFTGDDITSNAVRHHIPYPIAQQGPTCWYASTYNMLKYWKFPQELEAFDEFRTRVPAEGAEPDNWKWLEEFSNDHSEDRETKIRKMLFPENKSVPYILKVLSQSDINESKGQMLIDAANKGPFYIAVAGYPRFEDTTPWHSYTWGNLTLETGYRYRLSTANLESFKGEAHAMVCVGYIQRNVQSLYDKSIEESNGHKGPYNRFTDGINEFKNTGKTLELLLMNPQEPNMSFTDYDTNNLVLVDYHHLQTRKGTSRTPNIKQIIQLLPDPDKRSTRR